MDSGLLCEGGTILFDNALFRGNPYLEETTEESNPMGWGIKKCNEFVAADPRVRCVSCLNKTKFLSSKLLIFSYSSVLTYVLGAQKNRLNETVLMSTHNICFG